MLWDRARVAQSQQNHQAEILYQEAFDILDGLDDQKEHADELYEEMARGLRFSSHS